MPAGSGADLAEVRAAGAVLWRPGPDGPSGAQVAADGLPGLQGPPGARMADGRQVALVHRPRYDDWSLPKGKIARGEHVLQAAVREVAEETGVRVVLGRRLPSTRYQSHGQPKIVDYWAARAAAGPQPGFTPNDEVDELDWLPLPAARQRLTYPHDCEVLEEFAAGPPDTVPVVLLRHAAARSKGDWRVTGHPDDLTRPLAPTGDREAVTLAALLRCFAPGRVLSSAAERCVGTVRPYAAVAGTEVAADRAFTVGLASPADIRRRTAEVVAYEAGVVVCGHRENLPVILEEACAALGAKPPDDRGLPLGGFWVLHSGPRMLASAERHHLLPG
jgi:8-oxo-(d)GTP phosphatase